MNMDTFVDERDFSLLEHDRYTFFVLRRIIGGSCRTLLSNHESLIICYTGEPYPVWIWTADGAPAEIMEKAYSLASENGFVNNGQRFNIKYDLAEYMIHRAAEDGDPQIRYEILSESGPDHAKIFTSAVYAYGKQAGEGSGKSKKEAEQQAAAAALASFQTKR